MTLPNGPYAFYVDAKLPPIICEIFCGWVYEVGEVYYRPLSSYKNGRFVRLVEANADAIADLILENSLAADALVKAAQEPDLPAHGYFAGTGKLAYVPDAEEASDV